MVFPFAPILSPASTLIQEFGFTATPQNSGKTGTGDRSWRKASLFLALTDNCHFDHTRRVQCFTVKWHSVLLNPTLVDVFVSK